MVSIGFSVRCQIARFSTDFDPHSRAVGASFSRIALENQSNVVALLLLGLGDGGIMGADLAAPSDLGIFNRLLVLCHCLDLGLAAGR